MTIQEKHNNRSQWGKGVESGQSTTLLAKPNIHVQKSSAISCLLRLARNYLKCYIRTISTVYGRRNSKSDFGGARSHTAKAKKERKEKDLQFELETFSALASYSLDFVPPNYHSFRSMPIPSRNQVSTASAFVRCPICGKGCHNKTFRLDNLITSIF